MVIKASARPAVKPLVEALLGDDAVMRESAIARLAIIGSRAGAPLMTAFAEARDREARVALLRAMEAIADRRAAPVAAGALQDGGDVAVAAVGVLRALLTASHLPTATAALDRLVSTSLDRTAEHRVRVAAFESLQDMPEVRRRIANALRDAGDTVLRMEREDGAQRAAEADALWADAVAGRLPDDPGALRDVVRSRASSTPLTVLRRLIEAIRTREAAASGARGAEWRALRGTLHQTLALRGSRVALYDLRETIAEAAEPLPVSYLAALHVLGDASCLEPLAAAYARAAGRDAWWRHQLAAAFDAVARRERVTRRHAAWKRIESRWPEILSAAADLQ